MSTNWKDATAKLTILLRTILLVIFLTLLNAETLKNKTSDSAEENSNIDSYHNDTFIKYPVDKTIYLENTDTGEYLKQYKVLRIKCKSNRDTKIEALKIANTAYSFTTIFAKIDN